MDLLDGLNLECVVTTNTISEADHQLDILSHILGLFVDPITKILSPIIKIWQISLEHRKLEIYREELRSRTALNNKIIEAHITVTIEVIRQREREFNVLALVCVEHLRNRENQINSIQKAQKHLFELLRSETDHTSKIFYQNLLSRTMDALSAGEMKSAEILLMLIKTSNNSTIALLEKLKR